MNGCCGRRALLVLIPWLLCYVVWLFWLCDLVLGEPLGFWADIIQSLTFILVAHLIAAVVFRQARMRHVREALRRHGFRRLPELRLLAARIGRGRCATLSRMR